MAERRMFAKTIIDSDAFLDMPHTTQLLYFHLSMRADDDGFINNPRSIMRNAKCSESDLQMLAQKKFIIPFESGVVVIKHWKIHNYIRNDRYKETKYKEEKATLALDENNAYTQSFFVEENQMDTVGIPSGNQKDTQDRLGKDRLGKDNIIIDSASIEAEPTPPTKRTDYQEIVDMFHNLCPSYPSVKKISDARKKAIKARLNAYSIGDFKTLFEKAEASDFLKGANDRNWQANFDWLIKDSNMAKVLDGNYDNRQKQQRRNGYNAAPHRQYDMDAMEGMLLRAQNPAPTVDDDAGLKAEADELQRMLQEKYARSV